MSFGYVESVKPEIPLCNCIGTDDPNCCANKRLAEKLAPYALIVKKELLDDEGKYNGLVSTNL